MRYVTFFLAVVSVSFAGCTLRNAQVTACQAEKDQLLTTIRTQRDTTRSLQTQVASLESRLDQAEKELARTSTGTRLSSVPSGSGDPPRSMPVSAPSASSAPAQPPIRSEGLPWRSPASKTEQDPPPRDLRRGGINSGSADASLLALARRDRRVQYNAEAHAARLDVPVSFEDKSATLTAEGKRQLDDLARLLKSDDARELRVMVAGFAAGKPPAAGSKDGDERFADRKSR